MKHENGRRGWQRSFYVSTSKFLKWNLKNLFFIFIILCKFPSSIHTVYYSVIITEFIGNTFVHVQILIFSHFVTQCPFPQPIQFLLNNFPCRICCLTFSAQIFCSNLSVIRGPGLLQELRSKKEHEKKGALFFNYSKLILDLSMENFLAGMFSTKCNQGLTVVKWAKRGWMLKVPPLIPRTYISRSSKIDPTEGR